MPRIYFLSSLLAAFAFFFLLLMPQTVLAAQCDATESVAYIDSIEPSTGTTTTFIDFRGHITNCSGISNPLYQLVGYKNGNVSFPEVIAGGESPLVVDNNGNFTVNNYVFSSEGNWLIKVVDNFYGTGILSTYFKTAGNFPYVNITYESPYCGSPVNGDARNCPEICPAMQTEQGWMCKGGAYETVRDNCRPNDTTLPLCSSKSHGDTNPAYPNYPYAGVCLLENGSKGVACPSSDLFLCSEDNPNSQYYNKIMCYLPQEEGTPNITLDLGGTYDQLPRENPNAQIPLNSNSVAASITGLFKSFATTYYSNLYRDSTLLSSLTITLGDAGGCTFSINNTSEELIYDPACALEISGDSLIYNVTYKINTVRLPKGTFLDQVSYRKQIDRTSEIINITDALLTIIDSNDFNISSATPNPISPGTNLTVSLNKAIINASYSPILYQLSSFNEKINLIQGSAIACAVENCILNVNIPTNQTTGKYYLEVTQRIQTTNPLTITYGNKIEIATPGTACTPKENLPTTNCSTSQVEPAEECGNGGFKCLDSSRQLCKASENTYNCQLTSALPPEPSQCKVPEADPPNCSDLTSQGYTVEPPAQEQCTPTGGAENSGKQCRLATQKFCKDTNDENKIKCATPPGTASQSTTTAGAIPCDPKGGTGGTGILTALGCVPTEPKQFIEATLRVIIYASGGIALLLMALGGIQIISSLGNAEQLKKGQEQFTAAIIGLLFIIFSVLLMKIIGVDILNIPGFS